MCIKKYLAIIAAVPLSVSMTSAARSQVVQLPSVGSFSVSTTVSVPDQGTASLGGNGYSSYGQTTRGFGPLASRGIGGQVGAGGMSVSATIIDLQAMDEAIMNLPAGAAIPQNHAARAHGTEIINTLSPQRTERRSQRNIRVQDPNAWAVALGSPGNVQHESAEMLVQDGTDIRYFIDKCTEATSQGRIAAARVYYQMALDRMSPEQKKRMETLQARNAEAAKGKKPKKDKPAANSSATAAAATAPGAAPANGADSPTDQDASPF